MFNRIKCFWATIQDEVQKWMIEGGPEEVVDNPSEGTAGVSQTHNGY